MKNEKNNKEEESWQFYFCGEMANKINLDNENADIGESIYVANLFLHF